MKSMHRKWLIFIASLKSYAPHVSKYFKINEYLMLVKKAIEIILKLKFKVLKCYIIYLFQYKIKHTILAI